MYEFTDSEIPEFALRPEHWGDKIMGFIGYNDIDFPGDERFSKMYHLSGPDEGAILSYFNYDRLNLLVNEGKLNFESKENTLLIYRQNKRFKPEHLKSEASHYL